MKILGLRSIIVKKYNHAEGAKTDDTKEYPNILGQNFNADKPGQKNGIFHSDRGNQYTSNKFEKVLSDNDVKHSYSKKGYPYDNASMENFNAILKKRSQCK